MNKGRGGCKQNERHLTGRKPSSASKFTLRIPSNRRWSTFTVERRDLQEQFAKRNRKGNARRRVIVVDSDGRGESRNEEIKSERRPLARARAYSERPRKKTKEQRAYKGEARKRKGAGGRRGGAPLKIIDSDTSSDLIHRYLSPLVYIRLGSSFVSPAELSRITVVLALGLHTASRQPRVSARARSLFDKQTRRWVKAF